MKSTPITSSRSNENYILSSVCLLDFLIIKTETGNSCNLKLYFLYNKFILFLHYSEKCGLLATWMVCSHPHKAIKNSWYIIQTNIGYRRWKLPFVLWKPVTRLKNHLAWINCGSINFHDLTIMSTLTFRFVNLPIGKRHFTCCIYKV